MTGGLYRISVTTEKVQSQKTRFFVLISLQHKNQIRIKNFSISCPALKINDSLKFLETENIGDKIK
jgi:hypothetical protein